MARRGAVRVWSIGIALAAVFTIVVDFAAIGTRSNASVALELVGPPNIALPADPDVSVEPARPLDSSPRSAPPSSARWAAAASRTATISEIPSPSEMA